MKYFIFLSGIALSLQSNIVFSQVDPDMVDSLMDKYIDSFDSTGIVFYKPNTVAPGDPFSIYSSYFLSSGDHTMILKDQWTDEIAGYDHYYYELHYKGYRVEAMDFTEHAANGSIKYAHGKLAELFEDPAAWDLLTEAQAFSGLLAYLEYEADIEWAWENPSWEQQARTLSQDSNATYDPLGQSELLWAVDNLHELDYQNDPSRFQLCWKFELTTIAPHTVVQYYVHAVTGDIYKEQNGMFEARGTAITHNYGVMDIETTQKGWPVKKYQLIAKIGSNSYETRDGDDTEYEWSKVDVIKDGDNLWTDIPNRDAYTVQALVGAIWTYMEDHLSWTGISDGRNSDHLHCITNTGLTRNRTLTVPVNGNGWLIHLSDKENGITDPERDLETIAHEYAHTIMISRGKLGLGFETGALHESFCDILAVLIEDEVKVNTDWVAFEYSSSLIKRRSLIAPKSAGVHYTNAQCTTKALGQPNTYKGDYWHASSWHCDAGGIHVNCGVPNHWFYLLVNGGSGTNDKNKAYSVNGIGVEKARAIFFQTFINSLQAGSSFMDCRNLSIQTAIDLYGKCSEEYKQVMNAWYAVNVGNAHTCNSNGSLNKQGCLPTSIPIQ